MFHLAESTPRISELKRRFNETDDPTVPDTRHFPISPLERKALEEYAARDCWPLIEKQVIDTPIEPMTMRLARDTVLKLVEKRVISDSSANNLERVTYSLKHNFGGRL